MSKELPYFKFYVNEWITGDITLEDYEVQGLFINLCAYYWSKNCNIKYTNAKRKFKDAKSESFDALLSAKIIKVDQNDVLIISFLDEQNVDREQLSITNSLNGKKGGAPKGNSNAQKAKNKPSSIEKQPIGNKKTTDEQPETSNIEEKRGEENIVDVYATTSTFLPFYTINQFEKEVEIGENEFTLLATRSSKHSKEELKDYLVEFISQQKALSKLTWPSVVDARKHFISWAAKQQKSKFNLNGSTLVSTEAVRRPLN